MNLEEKPRPEPQHMGHRQRRQPASSMGQGLTDKILVERAARGDAIAFSELVNRHYTRVLRVAYGLLKNREDAEDVVQDAFVRVHRRLTAFEGAAAFYTWLYRITVNLSIDQLRKRRRERRVDMEDDAARDALRNGATPWPRFDDAHPGQNVERTQMNGRLQTALAGLPDIHQAVLILREVEGMSYEEIAATLEIKKGTVMSRLFNARRAMQERLADLDRDNNVAPKGSLGA